MSCFIIKKQELFLFLGGNYKLNYLINTFCVNDCQKMQSTNQYDKSADKC